MNNHQLLREYIINWKQIEEIKPCNEDVFISEFIKFIDSIDSPEDISFDGTGSYFGHQVTIVPDRPFVHQKHLNFEVAYSSDKISVYDGNNNGFLTPEYLRMGHSHDSFPYLKIALLKCLTKNLGINNLRP